MSVLNVNVGGASISGYNTQTSDSDSDSVIDQVKVQVGTQSYDFDVRNDSGRTALKNTLQSLGLDSNDFQSVSGKAFLDSLPAELRSTFSALSQSFANMNIAQPGVVVSSDLVGRWSEFAGKAAMTGTTDINALVQAVLRDSYMENTKDLHFYAEKVKFYNQLKKEIREEASISRNLLSKTAGGEPTDVLSKPKLPVTFYNIPGFDEQGSPYVQKEVGVGGNEKQSAGDAMLAATSTSSTNVTSSTTIDRDPVVLDLDGDGIEFRDGPGLLINQTTTSFSNRVNGNQLQAGTDTVTEQFSQWVDADDGVLVLDRNGDGEIQGEDLFGDTAVTGRAATTGYEDLAAQDTNNDGKIDYKDANFADMKVWQDANRDGVAQEDELHNLYAVGVLEVDLANADTGASAAAAGANGYLAQTGEFTTTEGWITTKGELENYIQGLEEQLNSVGDDAQLANVDLQNMLQKQQQTMQQMSNISKMLHDTAMAIIRKIG
ncbi:hypothetical protein KAI87_03270 [Myxococcota bacterium]|nr:hypothetical protein [Myxococcota bacterium]